MFFLNSNNAIFGQRLEILEQNGSGTESRPVCSITFSETTAKNIDILFLYQMISTGIYLAVAVICLYLPGIFSKWM